MTNSLSAAIRRLAARRDAEGRTDRELLGAFASDRNQDAFTELARRHGPAAFTAAERAAQEIGFIDSIRVAVEALVTPGSAAAAAPASHPLP